MFPRFHSGIFVAIFLATASSLFAQGAPDENATVRVTVSVNPDGSSTAYRFDFANRRATATTTEKDGKLREKIRYTLDDAGKFATGEVSGPNGKLKFKTVYKYNAGGSLMQESQLAADDSVLHKIVYAYDAAGKQIGYSIFDGAGKLLGQTAPVAPQKSSSAKAKK